MKKKSQNETKQVKLQVLDFITCAKISNVKVFHTKVIQSAFTHNILFWLILLQKGIYGKHGFKVLSFRFYYLCKKKLNTERQSFSYKSYTISFSELLLRF